MTRWEGAEIDGPNQTPAEAYEDPTPSKTPA
jgi:hypothetical protein